MPATLAQSTTDLPALGRSWPADYPPVNIRGLALLARPQDVSAARRFAREYCQWRGISTAVCDDVLVCVSEVVTNVRHAFFPQGRPHIFVQLMQNGPFISVRVFDPDSSEACLAVMRAELAAPCLFDAGAESGRGLSSVVRPLSCRLGVARSAHALKCVSFSVDCLPSSDL